MNRAQLRAQMRRELRDDHPIDTLSGAIADATAATFAVALGSFSGAPQVVEIDSELLFCPVYASASLTYSSVIRGHHGTTAAAHSSGALVRIAPGFSTQQLNDALEHVIKRMNSLGLYQVKTLTPTYNSSIQGYDLATDLIDVYEVRAKPPGPSKAWPEIRSFDVAQDMPTTDFASGRALILHQSGYSGQSLRIKYKAPYTLFANDTAESSTLGIQDYAEDALLYGSLAHLSAFREIERAQIEGAELTQRGQDVPPRHRLSIAGTLDARFLERTGEIRRRLRVDYPAKTRMKE